MCWVAVQWQDSVVRAQGSSVECTSGFPLHTLPRTLPGPRTLDRRRYLLLLATTRSHQPSPLRK